MARVIVELSQLEQTRVKPFSSLIFGLIYLSVSQLFVTTLEPAWIVHGYGVF